MSSRLPHKGCSLTLPFLPPLLPPLCSSSRLRQLQSTAPHEESRRCEGEDATLQAGHDRITGAMPLPLLLLPLLLLLLLLLLR